MFSVVNSPTLGLLIGRGFIQPSKIDISPWKGIIRIGNQTQALVTSSAGHPAIKLQPEDWKTMQSAGQEIGSKPKVTTKPKPTSTSRRPSASPTVNTCSTGTLLDTINGLISVNKKDVVSKKEINVPKRLQARRLPKSRPMSAITSALARCSGASNPGANAAQVQSYAAYAGQYDGRDLLPTTCLAEQSTGCVSCGNFVHESCHHLGFCPECVFATSVDLQMTGPIFEANIVEWCCNPDSALSIAWRRKGGAAVRLGLPGYDLSKPSVVSKMEGCIRQVLRRGKSVRIHAAFPCTPWTSLQRLLLYLNPNHKTKLTAQRKISVGMVKLFLDATARLRREFGSLLAVSFEWPRYCEGWDPGKKAVATRLKKELPRVLDFDGCAFGLVSHKGDPMKKPWRIVTDHLRDRQLHGQVQRRQSPTCGVSGTRREAQRELHHQAGEHVGQAAEATQPRATSRGLPDLRSTKDAASASGRPGAAHDSRGGADTEVRRHAAPRQHGAPVQRVAGPGDSGHRRLSTCCRGRLENLLRSVRCTSTPTASSTRTG